MASWLVVGGGYTGARLADRLRARGDAVIVTRRTAGEGVRALDLSQPLPPAAELPRVDCVACLAPPGPDPAGDMQRLLALAAAAGARKLVYVSSTGVYPPAAGAWVDESWPVAPTTAAGRARAIAEATLAEHARIPWLALRAAGIYGPGRGLVERVRAGSYRIVGDGRAHVSRIHVEDLVTAIIAAAETAVTGAVNAADDAPDPIGDVADAIAAHVGVPAPPRVPVASVDPEVAGMLTADRRIANRRLRDELGVALAYPSWRASLAATAT